MILQFLQITNSTTLSDLSDVVGPRNTEYLLATNNLSWQPNIGRQFYQMQQYVIDNSEDVTWQRKSTILNRLTSDTDVFETASLLSESGWKVLSELDTLPNTLKIPETIEVPSSTSIIGDGIPIGRSIYELAMNGLSNPPHAIDPGIFNEYSNVKATQLIDPSSSYGSGDVFQYFNLPWGDITLYSSLSDSFVDFPVYPEELEDSRKANYSTMPDMLYQYEPWYVYTGSGPRSNSYTFKMHRDMFSGNHSDGQANDLIRFCEANCYPEFNGSAVNVSQVSLYIVGNLLINGILTDVSVKWNGPILSDGWYASFELTLTITEVSQQALNYNSVRNLPLIG